MVFVSGWVRRSTGICLLPQIQILLHEKRAKITQTVSFFPGLPCVRVLGNTSYLDCRLHIWPSCSWSASKSRRGELIIQDNDIHEAEDEEYSGWSTGNMNLLTIIVGSWQINLAGMPSFFDPLWQLQDYCASEISYGHSYDVNVYSGCIWEMIRTQGEGPRP